MTHVLVINDDEYFKFGSLYDTIMFELNFFDLDSLILTISTETIRLDSSKEQLLATLSSPTDRSWAIRSLAVDL